MYPKREDFPNTKAGEQEYNEICHEQDEIKSLVVGQINNRAKVYAQVQANWIENVMYFYGLSPAEMDNYTLEKYQDGEKEVIKKIRKTKSKLYTALNLTAISRINNRVPTFISQSRNKRFAKIGTILASYLTFKLKNSNVKFHLQELAKNFLDTGMAIIKFENGYFTPVSPFQFLASANWKGTIQCADWVAFRKLESREELAKRYPTLKDELTDKDSKEYKRSYYGESGSMEYRNLLTLDTVDFGLKIQNSIKDFENDQYIGMSSMDMFVEQDEQIEFTEYWNKSLKKKYCLIGDQIVYEEDFDGFYPLAVAVYLWDSSSNFPIAMNTLALSVAKQADVFYNEHLQNVLFHSLGNYATIDTQRVDGSTISRTVFPMKNAALASVSTSDSVDPIKFIQAGYTNQEAWSIFQSLARNLYALYGIASTLQGGTQGETTAREAQLKSTESIQNLEFMGRKMLDEIYTEIGKIVLEQDLNDGDPFRMFESQKNDISGKYLYIKESKRNKKGNIEFKLGKKTYEISDTIDESDLATKLNNLNGMEVEQSVDSQGLKMANEFLDTIEEVTQTTKAVTSDEFAEQLKSATMNDIEGYFTNIDLEENITFTLAAISGTAINNQIIFDKLAQQRMLALQGKEDTSLITQAIYDMLDLGEYINVPRPVEGAEMQGNPLESLLGQIKGQGEGEGEGMNAANFGKQSLDSNYLNDPTTVPGNSITTFNPTGIQ
jgi:hypothetical protein